MSMATMATAAVEDTRYPRLSTLGFVLVVGGVATAVTILDLGEGAHEGVDGLSVTRGLVVALYTAVGTYTTWRRPGSRFGLMMIAIGPFYAVAALASSQDEVAHTIGRVALAAFVLCLTYVLLCFPHDHLVSRVERRVFVAFSVAGAVVWVAALPLLEKLPPGGPLTDCGHACPDNAARLVTTSHALSSALGSVVTAVTAAGLLGVTAALAGRIRSPVRLERSLLLPVTACTAVLAVDYSLFTILREAGVDSLGGMKIVGASAALAIPAAMFLGQIRGRLFAATSLSHLVARASGQPVTPALVERLLRDALGDRLLLLALWDPVRGEYVDVHGRPIEVPTDRQDLRVTSVSREGRIFAAVIHDAALDEDDSVAQGLAATSLMLLENTQLTDELRASRARIVSSAQRERLRLERNLHDGAQQRLFAIQIKLDAASEQTQNEELATELAEIAADAAAAVEELRELAHGLYPTVLRERGMADGLRSIAYGSAIPVRVVDRGVGRCSATVEEAVYFCALEAIQNASKHAGRGAHVWATLERRSRDLEFTVEDDGRGFDVQEHSGGVGLISMRDRIGAVGGEMDVRSEPGSGTRVHAVIPNCWPPAGPESGRPFEPLPVHSIGMTMRPRR
jgi:signal transduction histidine kinase